MLNLRLRSWGHGEFPSAKTKKEVWSFLGLTGYYRHFNASMAVPLTNLTRKKCPEIVVWTAECDKAFNALKDMLTSTPLLRSPDFLRKHSFFKQMTVIMVLVQL